jgi:endonuclease/exonuclease/phosphatase family metal-dependent hydrolase
MKPLLSLASYNIWKDGGNFPKRIQEMGERLGGIDVLALQEDYGSKYFSSSSEINKLLNLHKTTLPLRQKERHAILSTSSLSLLSKYAPQVLKTIVLNKGEEDERGVQIIKIEIKSEIQNTVCVIVNTHLSHLDPSNRIKQISFILRALESLSFTPDMTLVCGDMNALADSEEIQLFERNRFISVNTEPTHEDGSVIDYIFYKTDLRVQVSSEIIIKDLSDHYCLKNVFSLSD